MMKSRSKRVIIRYLLIQSLGLFKTFSALFPVVCCGGHHEALADAGAKQIKCPSR